MIEFRDALAAWKALRVELAQDHGELESLYNLIQQQHPRNLLEIGSRNGGSLSVLGQAMPYRARIVGVDLPGAAWGHENSAENLERIADWLRSGKYDVHIIYGNSQHAEVISQVRELLPEIDVCFIDGDHTYEGIRADWLNYGQHAKMTIFHDTAGVSGKRPNGHIMGVPKFWKEIRERYRHEEFSNQDGRYGIGVVFPCE